MRTVRCSSRLSGGGVSAKSGVLPGVWLPGRLSAWGCLPKGVSARRECLPGGCVCPWRCLPKGVYTLPLWIEFLAHACENITLCRLFYTINSLLVTEACATCRPSERQIKFCQSWRWIHLVKVTVTGGLHLGGVCIQWGLHLGGSSHPPEGEGSLQSPPN